MLVFCLLLRTEHGCCPLMLHLLSMERRCLLQKCCLAAGGGGAAHEHRTADRCYGGGGLTKVLEADAIWPGAGSRCDGTGRVCGLTKLLLKLGS